MDLRETDQATDRRHPWELSRIRALRAIARNWDVVASEVKVLDTGCGDGFIIDELCAGSGAVIDAVDIHLTADQARSFAAMRPGVQFHHDHTSLPGNSYGLLTMFDVLEHVPDDVTFLREILSRFARPGAVFFCTVPAFQCLFSAHDQFLGHQRRYTQDGLHHVLARAGLRIRASGYLFASLLPVRALVALAEKVLGVAETRPGIGQWQGGRLLTSLLTGALDIDNALLLGLNRVGITIPGLTVWAVCETLR